jgi:hypothetical protein
MWIRIQNTGPIYLGLLGGDLGERQLVGELRPVLAWDTRAEVMGETRALLRQEVSRCASLDERGWGGLEYPPTVNFKKCWNVPVSVIKETKN